jgi:hypothetical protein
MMQIIKRLLRRYSGSLLLSSSMVVGILVAS